MEIAIYAVWFNVLPSDSRSGWDPTLLTDPRVTHLWDEEGVTGPWFAEQSEAIGFSPPGSLVWDAFLLFPTDAQWEEVPSPLIAWGAPVIGHRQSLEDGIVSLLEGHPDE